MKLQYQLSNGNWTDCGDRTDEFLQRCVANNSHSGIITIDQVLQALSEGKNLRNAPADWYSKCRDIEAIERIRAEYLKKNPLKPVKMVKCTCGHTVRKESVMLASMGTSCPDCYDEMSD